MTEKLEAVHLSMKQLFQAIEAGDLAVDLIMMEVVYKIIFYIDCLRRQAASNLESERLEALRVSDHWDT